MSLSKRLYNIYIFVFYKRCVVKQLLTDKCVDIFIYFIIFEN
nr:hypothetical protein [Bacteroides sp.]